MKRVQIINKETGEVKSVKRYSTGWVDCFGNFYHRAHWRIYINPTA